MTEKMKSIRVQNTFTNYVLLHKPSGFYVTSADTFTDNVSKAKVYETNAKRNSTEWHDKLSTNDYSVVTRTETITVNFEEVPF